MIAYDSRGLDNRIVRDEAGKALEANCIDPEEGRRIDAAYPDLFYTPNQYIRIGLFILTVIIVVFSLGLFMLMGGTTGNAFEGLILCTGMLCYGILEFFVKGIRHFRSGVDDALLWMSGGLTMTGISLIWNSAKMVELWVLILLLSGWFVIRFADRLMAVVSFAALMGIVVLFLQKYGWSWMVFGLFVDMTISLLVFSLGGKLRLKNYFRNYRVCLDFVRGAALIAFYLAGNYYVLQQIGEEHSLHPGILLRLLFWALTVLTPLVYIILGLRNKNRLLLDIGLLLIAAAIFTIRYYYHVLPMEWAMTIGGIFLIGLAYGCMRYLKTPQKGFTCEPDTDLHFAEVLNLEALVIAETFKSAITPAPGNDVKFGGGSGGGGGAGGDF